MLKPKDLQPTTIPTPQPDATSADVREPEKWLASARAWTERPPADSEKDPLIGTTLNEDYVVERLLGEGGMGRVYQAHHTRIAQKQYAIKVLRAEMAGNTEVLQRFQREAEAAACISHPNVVGVYDVARTPTGLPYLACEYLQGVELADYLEQVGTLNHVTAVNICVQICEALEAAHAQGVIHRDLKPQNIFLVGDFSQGVPTRPLAKVLDFGLSRFQDVTGNTLTRTGVVMGTPSFMAPEQARGERTDTRTDIYGVGAILYTLLTGRLPFAEETPSMTILAVMARDPPRPRSIDPSISERLELVVQTAMAKQPSDRYPDVTTLKLALEPFTTPGAGVALSTQASRVSLDAEALEVSSARPRLVLVLLLTVVLLAAILAMALVGVGVLTGWLSFTVGELALLLVAAVGTTLTPAIILVRRMRREVWNNTARVLAALQSIRAPILVGLLGYGSVTLFVRFGDVVLARFASVPLLGHPSGIAWAGWDLVFPTVALLAAGATVLRERLLAPSLALRWRGFIAGPVLTTGGLMIGLGIVYGGLLWRAGSTNPLIGTPEVPVTPAQVSSSGASSSSVPSRVDTTARSSSPSAAKPPAPSSDGTARAASTTPRPSDEELAAAIRGGEKKLLPLSEQYPDAPEVLRPLVIAFASRATGLADAMVVTRRLFAAAPEQARDTTMRLLVGKAAQTAGRSSELAFELMTKDMGTAGMDLLYELMLTRASLTEKVQKMLLRQDLQARMSPALKIAYDLRRANSCAGRLPLLDRAAALGDERSVTILQPLTQVRKRGCGKWKNQPCPAPCAAEAAAYRNAIAQISSRLSGAP